MKVSPIILPKLYNIVFFFGIEKFILLSNSDYLITSIPYHSINKELVKKHNKLSIKNKTNLNLIYNKIDNRY